MENFLKIIDELKWPIAVIICVIFFKKPIVRLLDRVKSLRGGNYGLETENRITQEDAGKPLKEDVAKPLPENADKVSKITTTKASSLEKSLSLFSDATRSKIQEVVENESEISAVETDKERAEILFNYSEAILTILIFERIYNLIFGSQLAILNYLNSSFNESLSSIKFFYENAIKNYPDLANYSYEQYIAFLHRNELVEIDENSNIIISWRGRDFLKFLIQRGLSDLKIY